MSFNNVQPGSGPFTLKAGASMRIGFWYGGGSGQQAGQDRGAQWIMADPVHGKIGQAFPQSLTVSGFTKVREFVVGPHPHGSLGFIDLSRTVVRYEVTVTNSGPNTSAFAIQGGGNT